MIHELITLLLTLSAKMGYTGIVALMAVESSFIPFPSEVVVPPAAYLASQGEMNIYLVVLAGIAGSLIGASVNYALAMTLGRRMVYALAGHRICRLFRVDADKIKTAEYYFRRYGRISTFFGRLIPAVRQLISIPAGFSRMNFGAFLLYTFLGSGIWTIVLAILGYVFGANQEALARHYKVATLAAVLLVLLAVSIILLKKRKEKLYAQNQSAQEVPNNSQAPNTNSKNYE